MSAETLYEVLGISEDAPNEEVRRAYRALALRYHPVRAASRSK
jgi:DnaJ-class molecular chaperone